MWREGHFRNVSALKSTALQSCEDVNWAKVAVWLVTYVLHVWNLQVQLRSTFFHEGSLRSVVCLFSKSTECCSHPIMRAVQLLARALARSGPARISPNVRCISVSGDEARDFLVSWSTQQETAEAREACKQVMRACHVCRLSETWNSWQ
jgi:hypothetical protein